MVPQEPEHERGPKMVPQEPVYVSEQAKKSLVAEKEPGMVPQGPVCVL